MNWKALGERHGEIVAKVVFIGGKHGLFEALAVLVLALACWQDGSQFSAGLLAGIGGTVLVYALRAAGIPEGE